MQEYNIEVGVGKLQPFYDVHKRLPAGHLRSKPLCGACAGKKRKDAASWLLSNKHSVATELCPFRTSNVSLQMKRECGRGISSSSSLCSICV